MSCASPTIWGLPHAECFFSFYSGVQSFPPPPDVPLSGVQSPPGSLAGSAAGAIAASAGPKAGDPSGRNKPTSINIRVSVSPTPGSSKCFCWMCSNQPHGLLAVAHRKAQRELHQIPRCVRKLLHLHGPPAFVDVPQRDPGVRLVAGQRGIRMQPFVRPSQTRPTHNRLREL